MNYWQECISEAFDEAGITSTPEQINTVASWIEGAHENHSMAHGHDCIPNPTEEENKRLKMELAKEQSKIVCIECKGRGRITSYGGTFQSNSECTKCRGEGKVAP